ncbi:cell division protein SepF [Sporosarcina thermotolerans]|uniref:Cell division protein SepF n=1 Tax=Sporosarcina thermotolerans TaxID=633404 RepID=A0AAW9A4V0_9BACL|nr:cell division protein SepF [Sporosarcina thermotolerans]MDW0115805.1 cell division protein SepF [Sporosarcina thermotolerans]WHT46958.1 cell division protein SepF [Sporosarcina thermotolerans]
MSIKRKFEKWFYLEDEEEIQQEQPVRQQPPTQEQQPRKVASRKQQVAETQQPGTVVSLQSLQKSSKVVLFEPRVYAEAQDISEHLKNKRAVVVNLQRIERDQGIRIVDFLSGTVYALGGDIQRIGTDIFLCVPENVEVAGSISDFFER